MSLTRANVEVILIKRTGKFLAKINLDGTTQDGTNTDLNDPIGQALRRLGYSVVDPTQIVDGDVDSLLAEDLNAFLDVAELRVLDTIMNNLMLVDIGVGPRKESLGQLRSGLLERIAALRKVIDEEHGLGGRTAEPGYIVFDFEEDLEEIIS